MNELFLVILDRTVIGSYVIVVILGLRCLLKNMSKRFSYLLWICAFLVLSIPIQMTGSYSLQPDLNGITPSLVVERSQIEQAMDSSYEGMSVQNDVKSQEKLHEQGNLSSSGTDASVDWLSTARLIWMLVALSIMVFNVFQTIRLKFSLADAIPENQQIYLTDRTDAPFVFGFFRPRIYLPKNMDEQTRQCVLAHEFVHLRRHDLWIKMFVFTVLCLHWMNPLVHIAYRCMINDMEMSCDEAAIDKLQISPRVYARSLLNVAAGSQQIYAMCTFAQGNIKQRIKHIISYHRIGSGIGLALVCLLLCISIGLLVMPNRSYKAPSSTSEGLQQIFAHSINERQDYQEILPYLDFSDFYELDDRNVDTQEKQTGETPIEHRLTMHLHFMQAEHIQNVTDLPCDPLVYNASVLFALDPLLTKVDYVVEKNDQVYQIGYYYPNTELGYEACEDAAAYANRVNEICQIFETCEKNAYMDKKDVYQLMQTYLPLGDHAEINSVSIYPSQDQTITYSYTFAQEDDTTQDVSECPHVNLTFSNKGLTGYTCKYYESDQNRENLLDEKQAQEMVDHFTQDYRQDFSAIHFEKKDVETNHLFWKGHYETWTAPGEDGMSVIVVDLKEGGIAEAYFG